MTTTRTAGILLYADGKLLIDKDCAAPACSAGSDTSLRKKPSNNSSAKSDDSRLRSTENARSFPLPALRGAVSR